MSFKKTDLIRLTLLKKVILGLFLLGLVGLGFYLNNHFSKPYQKIEFSQTLYPKERAIVQEMFSKEILDSKRMGAFGDAEISIAKYDLNQDGIQDIFVMISGGSFCGSQGCLTMIYVVDKRGVWHEAYRFNTYPAWGVSHQKHNGYFDLVHVGSVDNHPISDCFLLKYAWKNDHYEGVGYRKLTKKDLEVLVDEDVR